MRPPVWIHWLITALLFCSTIASAIGAYEAHFPPTSTDVVFGATSGSMALIAFALNITLFVTSLQHALTGSMSRTK